MCYNDSLLFKGLASKSHNPKLTGKPKLQCDEIHGTENIHYINRIFVYSFLSIFMYNEQIKLLCPQYATLSHQN